MKVFPETLNNEEHLLKLEANQVLGFLRTFEKEQMEVNWLSLADKLALKTRRKAQDTTTDQALIWGEAASIAYNQSKKHSKAFQHQFIELSDMMLRAFLIKQFGPAKDHQLLDSGKIIAWFFENLSFTFEEAQTLSGQLSQLTQAKIIELRQIRNRLSVVSMLTANNCWQPSEELVCWLSLKKKLP